MSDPYYDENDSSEKVSKMHLPKTISSPHLGENIMRKVDRDPYEVYEHAKVLGTGSMGSVNMVKKRDNEVGGTARWHNLSVRKQLEMKGIHPSIVTLLTLPLVGNWFRNCTGINNNEKREEGDAEDELDLSRACADSTKSNDETLSLDGTRHTTLDRSLHSSPAHVRINKYFESGKMNGKYEAYYALKSIHLSRVHDDLFINELKNEIEIMKGLDHAHITRLIETYEHRGHLYMVMELCSGGDLYSRDPYTEDQAARITSSILSAVDYMHKHSIVHRDLKYENVLFANASPKAEIKIIDFGLSKKYLPDQRLKEGVGTVYTMSPEVLSGDYTNKADVWAVGVLAYMLLSSQMPFFGRKRRDILEKIMRCKYDFRGRRWSTVSHTAKNFVSDLLRKDPNERPCAQEAKQSLWLNMKLTSSLRTASEDDMDAVATSLECYSAHKTLQKLALLIIAHKSNSEDIGFLRKVFKRYDKNKDGAISLSEFKQCLSKYEFSDDHVEELFNSVDLDGTKEIKYTEFLAATIESTGLVTEERLAEAFDRLDSDDSGYISIQVSHRALKNDFFLLINILRL
jgi:calcium-dependent protein kinase